MCIRDSYRPYRRAGLVGDDAAKAGDDVRVVNVADVLAQAGACKAHDVRGPQAVFGGYLVAWTQGARHARLECML